jgi:acetyltransferase-like isoleucine patch superfamily enzyme
VITDRIKNRWRRFWLAQRNPTIWRRFSSTMAGLGVPPYKGRTALAWLHPNGYIAPSANIRSEDLRLGKHVFIGERVVVYRQGNGKPVEIGDAVELHQDCIIEVLEDGAVTIGPRTTIQARCNFASACAPIQIGSCVQIAQACGFYSFDHGVAPDQPIYEQLVQSKGPIIIEDDAWLGFNVIVLSGVRIGRGAVIGAGSVVTRDVPAAAIVAGAPARILRMRDQSTSIAQVP